jgi:hypothetical protein
MVYLCSWRLCTYDCVMYQGGDLDASNIAVPQHAVIVESSSTLFEQQAETPRVARACSRDCAVDFAASYCVYSYI